MSDNKKNRPFFSRRRQQNPRRKRKWFGMRRDRTQAETEEESRDRLQSSESAKKLIESFEKDTSSYRHSEHQDGKVAPVLSFVLTLAAALIIIVIAVLVFFFRKGQ